ncbi:MAG: DUF3604 domain-containing protein [bacterium]|nr:DUF3604 domain-containing protein [bacterium]
MNSYIESKLIGEAWPSVQPFEDPEIYGSIELEPRGEFVVRSFATFTLTYTAGRYGIDDSGAIRVAFRMVGDWGRLQTDNPAAPNYVRAATNGNARLVLDASPNGMSPRPRNKCLTIRVTGGYLEAGETITIVFGDTSQGSPGLQLQTFAETAFEFKVSVDPCAVGHFVPLAVPLEIAIVPDEPFVWKAVLPSLRRPAEDFRFGFKAEDAWGNPTPKAQGRFRLVASLPVDGLPEQFDCPSDLKLVVFENLKVSLEGVLRIEVLDEAGQRVAESNPMVVKAGVRAGFWGDLHGQSGESIGVGAAKEYFEFARDRAFLDVTSHQANDFQVNQAFWQYLNQLTREFQQDGHFVAFPGYEWSGNTGVGGDRNVFFKNEGRPMRRSSHALLTDQSDITTDANDAQKLFKALADEDCLTYAHVGGRYANVAFAHDPAIETAMEIHSAWGTFEWLMADCFELGHRVGVVCNSDDHKGRPGASYPGASTFGAYGGLTCFLAEELTRDGIFECLRRRHHYGTTGTRLHLDVRAVFSTNGHVFNRDPKVFENAESHETREVVMGDIAHTEDQTVMLRLAAVTQAGIERIEIRNGTEVLETIRGYGPRELGARIRVIWSGAEYRGRRRETTWQGQAGFEKAAIRHWQGINAWNPERRFEMVNNDTVVFDAITTGNFGGFDAWLDEGPEAQLEIETNHGSIAVKLSDLDMKETMMEAGGLERCLRIFRLPEKNLPREYEAEIEVALKPKGDNPIWVCLTLEDGSQAWSSPIYLYNDE